MFYDPKQRVLYAEILQRNDLSSLKDGITVQKV